MAIPVISNAQMREWEKATWAAGQTEAEVIRRVGKCVAELALKLTSRGDRILILAGKGHNGEDARHAQQHLSDRTVELLNVADPATDFGGLDVMLSARPALVIDGLFGIGINRPLSPPWVKFIERINSSGLPVLAVDVPSGLDADTGQPQGAAIEAQVTLTVGAPKRGLLESTAWRYVGRLEVAVDVGLATPPVQGEIYWTVPEDFAGFPPRRPVAAHKGSFGRIAIVAGSLGYHGAAVLAARGAQRAQPGLISLFPQESIYTPVAAQLQAVMVHPWNAGIDLAAKFDAVLFGPGLAAPGLPEPLPAAVRQLWKEAEIPIVVDASALEWLVEGSIPDKAVRVITPHPGEAARLLKENTADVQAERVSSLRELSRRFGNCWVVLKGHQTIVGRSTGELFVNSSGNPFLAQGGSGDVLAGYISGLIAQSALRQDVGKTIRFAVWQHGAAADSLAALRPNWVVEDLLNSIGSLAAPR